MTGELYTLVFETTHENLTSLESDMKGEMPDQRRNWYQKFPELVVSGYREIFTVVPIGQPSTTTKEKAYASSRT